MADLEFFKKPEPNCLSQYAISCYVNADFSFKDKEEIEKHLAACQRCSDLVNQEKIRLGDTQPESSQLPHRMRGRPISSWIRPNLVSFAIAGVLFLIVVFVILPKMEQHRKTIQAKGKNSLWLSVKRGDQIVHPLTNIEHVGTLSDGDEIRIRIKQTQTTSMALRGCAQQTCMLLFAEKIPEDGWLPIGLKASTGFSTLELWSCPTDQDRATALMQTQKPELEKFGKCQISTWQLMVAPN